MHSISTRHNFELTVSLKPTPTPTIAVKVTGKEARQVDMESTLRAG